MYEISLDTRREIWPLVAHPAAAYNSCGLRGNIVGKKVRVINDTLSMLKKSKRDRLKK